MLQGAELTCKTCDTQYAPHCAQYVCASSHSRIRLTGRRAIGWLRGFVRGRRAEAVSDPPMEFLGSDGFFNVVPILAIIGRESKHHAPIAVLACSTLYGVPSGIIIVAK
jgi:hypothetical protein